MQVCTVAKEMLSIREQNADVILRTVNQSLEMGMPINRPMWYVDPDDPTTFTVDDRKFAASYLTLLLHILYAYFTSFHHRIHVGR